MKRKYLPSYFTTDSALTWPCPNCMNNSLSINKESLVIKEDALTKGSEEYLSYNPEQASFVFSLWLTCSRNKCAEVVCVTGRSGADYDGECGELEQWYKAHYIHPPIPFIPCHKYYPEPLREMIMDTCAFLPHHHQSAVRNIRTILEYLLTDLGIDGGNLHRRIERYQGEYKSYFEALKWIGNTASHDDKHISEQEVEDTCELIDYLMRKIYEPEVDHGHLIERLLEVHKPRR